MITSGPFKCYWLCLLGVLCQVVDKCRINCIVLKHVGCFALYMLEISRCCERWVLCWASRKKLGLCKQAGNMWIPGSRSFVIASVLDEIPCKPLYASSLSVKVTKNMILELARSCISQPWR